ncbi:IS3 family transposase [Bordetella genomosp. 5]|uniref:IS3 family transposase n=1 Tax=Bordetella genomosp. 5 TaxID=1395608 RepID=UPI003D80A928
MRECGSTPVRRDNHDRIELKLKGLSPVQYRAQAFELQRLTVSLLRVSAKSGRHIETCRLQPSSPDRAEMGVSFCPGDASNHAADQPTDRWTDNALREVAARAFPRRHWTSSKGNALPDKGIDHSVSVLRLSWTAVKWSG